MKKRVILYLIGLNLIAVSVVLNIRYAMGVAAFSSVMYAISEIYAVSLGAASILCYLLFVACQCILSRRITLVYLLEIPLSFAFGLLTDFYDFLVPELPFMFVTAMGVFLCVRTDLVLTPTDGIVKTISEVFHVVFSRVKTALTSPWWPSAPCSAS